MADRLDRADCVLVWSEAEIYQYDVDGKAIEGGEEVGYVWQLPEYRQVGFALKQAD